MTTIPEGLPELHPDQYPTFVHNERDALRWRLCMGISGKLFGGDYMAAASMYRNPAFTMPDDVQEADFDPARHPRGRAGRFVRGLREEDVRQFDHQPRKGDMANDVLGDAMTTAELYHDPGAKSGTPQEYQYTQERMAGVHDPIISATLGDHASQEEPHVLVVAGGPASGKSTLLRDQPGVLPEDAVHIDADQVKAGVEGQHNGIPEYRDMLDAGDLYAAKGVHDESGDIAKKVLDQAMAKRTNIVLDTTGDREPGQFAADLQQLIDRGYKVDVLYVHLPTDIAVDRNIKRAVTEHRYVPTPVVRDYHRAAAVNFRDEIQHMPGLASVRVYDQRHGLVAEREEGQMVPKHAGAYAEWVAKADEPKQDLERGQDVEESADQEHAPVPKGVSIEMPFDLSDYVRPRKDRGDPYRKLKP